MGHQGKRVYFFGQGRADGDGGMAGLLGGKGANLAEMGRLGIPVPPGFTLTTEVCNAYYKEPHRWMDGLKEEVRWGIARVEEAMGAGFGDPDNPLLLSVRSGAPVSMPGMMSTVLNVGLNAATVEGLARRTGCRRFAYDTYRRFVQMYGDVVLGVPFGRSEGMWNLLKAARVAAPGGQVDGDELRELLAAFRARVAEAAGAPFPDDPMEQLWGAIRAVLDSWYRPRAVRYRELHGIPSELGTAVNVQAMVFGNLGDTSGAGVAFSRDPNTGERRLYGEYLLNAQGEDVVAGIRTPRPLATLRDVLPGVYTQLEEICRRLESHYRDVQDVEFTIQDGRLFILQTRAAKRAGKAAVRIAVDMVEEGLIDEQAALQRVEPESLVQMLKPAIREEGAGTVIATGLPASPGVAVGRVVFTAADAEAWRARGEQVILVRRETSTEDIAGMDAAAGVLTSVGGMTCHAAVVARGMGKCCVVGAGAIAIDAERREMRAGGLVVREGDWLTLDGSHGKVMYGKVALKEPELPPCFRRLMQWADRYARLAVRANADTPHEAALARAYGAAGIGLCRTEALFLEEGRIGALQDMLRAADERGRRQALRRLFDEHREHFYRIFQEMDGLPVAIQLFDKSLAELPVVKGEAFRGGRTGEGAGALWGERLREHNPVLGRRGARLGVVFRGLYEMQVEAIAAGAARFAAEGGRACPEVIIPMVGALPEFRHLKARLRMVAERVLAEAGVSFPIRFGATIEVPRAALLAHQIAREADFFTFCTGDLTQLAYGYSRADAEGFLPLYLEEGLLDEDPFERFDQMGVGELICIGVERGRKGRPDLPVGLLGVHGDDPSVAAFCHRVGIDYVSCSPCRVPLLRLAAAQAALGGGAASAN